MSVTERAAGLFECGKVEKILMIAYSSKQHLFPLQSIIFNYWTTAFGAEQNTEVITGNFSLSAEWLFFSTPTHNA